MSVVPIRTVHTVRLLVLVALICVAAPSSSALAKYRAPCFLKLTFGSRSEGPPQQFHVNLVLQNTADITNTSCRISGHPSVELIGPNNPLGTIYFLPRAAGRTETVTLRPGDKAHAIL